MNPNEAEFQQFLERSGIHALYAKAGPAVKNPETSNAHHPDFFVPSAKLYIEVKGRMSIPDIRFIGKLAGLSVNYYLYQPDDWDWDTQIADWPSSSLARGVARRMETRAKKAELEYLRVHPSRRTTSDFRKVAHKRHYRRELQREEVLELCASSETAQAASAITLTRVRRYLHNQVLELKRAGLVSLREIALVP